MPDSAIFDHLCGELERETTLTTLEARGTVRWALKDSGLGAASLEVEEGLAVLQQVLPKELSARGIENADEICARIAGGLSSAGVAATVSATAPEAVFERLGR